MEPTDNNTNQPQPNQQTQPANQTVYSSTQGSVNTNQTISEPQPQINTPISSAPEPNTNPLPELPNAGLQSASDHVAGPQPSVSQPMQAGAVGDLHETLSMPQDTSEASNKIFYLGLILMVISIAVAVFYYFFLR